MRQLSAYNIARIVQLLRETDLQMPAIAARMNCGKNTVYRINKQFGIRNYRGKRFWSPVPLPHHVRGVAQL